MNKTPVFAIRIVVSGALRNERLYVRKFADSSARDRFLNTGDNANFWRAPIAGSAEAKLTTGTYARVAGVWRNVKTLPVEVLNHV